MNTKDFLNYAYRFHHEQTQERLRRARAKVATVRVAESINFAFVDFLSILAWIRPLPAERRLRVTALDTLGMGLTVAAQLASLIL